MDRAATQDAREHLEELAKDRLDELAPGLHPADLAEALAPLPPEEVWQVLSRLPVEQQAATFGHLVPSDQVGLAHILPRAELAKIVSEMPADERADLYTPRRLLPILPRIPQCGGEGRRCAKSHRQGCIRGIPVEVSCRHMENVGSDGSHG